VAVTGMNRDKISFDLEISHLNYQRLQDFAQQRRLTLAEAIDRILTIHLAPNFPDYSNNLTPEVEIEDEPDEILWDFLEESN
jgi:macrodomain Ter protein organizer (MatP/YcbG family)